MRDAANRLIANEPNRDVKIRTLDANDVGKYINELITATLQWPTNPTWVAGSA